MLIEPIAVFHSPFRSKFGIPRQSGIVDDVHGTVEMLPPYTNGEALRGIDGFTHLWLLWGFSENVSTVKRSTVRPPRLGGNRHIGVFASRSPFRPNGIGLSSVRLVAVRDGKSVEVAGADLMDGTPIYDIKPYIPFTDSHPDAIGGFVDSHEWRALSVVFPDEFKRRLSANDVAAITKLLAQDPRPQYHNEPERIYGMPYSTHDIRFSVAGDTLTVVDIVELQKTSISAH